MADFLKDIEKKVNEILPPEAEVTNVDVEGPEIVIYTKNIKLFLDQEHIIKGLAGQLKKRFILRTDASQLLPPEEAKQKIQEIIPSEAEIQNIAFDKDFHEVVIEASKIGLVIGHHGSTLKEITRATGWSPKPLRVPTMNSKMLRSLRDLMIQESATRKKLLKKVGKRIFREQAKPTDWIKFTTLGASREVGRSSFLLETPESKVLLDCGIGMDTERQFPYLDSLNFSLEELDAVILSHGHLDHSGMIPYLYEYGYEGPIYCTTPTREVIALLQKDMVNVFMKNSKTPPYNEKAIKKEMLHCITRDYGEVTDITPDMRLTFQNAGHILGSAITHLHIGEGAHNLVYTGDMKFGFSELFNPAETRFPRIETLVIESTYAGSQHPTAPRFVAEKKLIETILKTTEKNGIVIIPSFAVERAQEAMLVIESYAKEHPDWDIPIYLDGMIKEACAIHTAYPEYLKKSVQRRILHNDSPFASHIFQAVDNPKQREEIVNQGRCVIISPAGMMNGGPIIDYFKRTCEDPRNSLIFMSYQAENTLGRKIQRGAKQVVLEDDKGTREYNINMNVQSIEGFSGHADLNQLLGFYKKLQPKPERVLTVHGEEKSCVNLARTLSYKFRVEASAPRNLDAIRLK